MNRRQLLSSAACGVVAASSVAIGRTAERALRPPKDGVFVAFVVGPDSTIIDFAGPWEAFSDVMVSTTPSGFGFRMAAVSDSLQALNFGGMIVTPNYTYDTVPSQPNVIVIGAQKDYTPAKIAWIKEAAKGADVVMSVCLGAFLLAKTGLLDGLKTTTHHSSYASFAKQFPQVQLIRGPRYVDNGKFATSGGESSGIDLAFEVVSRYYGPQAAADAADIMEFDRLTPRPS